MGSQERNQPRSKSVKFPPEGIYQVVFRLHLQEIISSLFVSCNSICLFLTKKTFKMKGHK